MDLENILIIVFIISD